MHESVSHFFFLVILVLPYGTTFFLVYFCWLSVRILFILWDTIGRDVSSGIFFSVQALSICSSHISLGYWKQVENWDVVRIQLYVFRWSENVKNALDQFLELVIFIYPPPGKFVSIFSLCITHF